MEAIMTMETAINLDGNWDQDNYLSCKIDERGSESIPSHEAKSQIPLGEKR